MVDFVEKLGFFGRQDMGFTLGTQGNDLSEQPIEVGFVELISSLDEFVEAHGYLGSCDSFLIINIPIELPS